MQKSSVGCQAECDEYIRIFEYIGHEYIFRHSFVSIFLLRIYSDIHSYQVFLYEYIRTFVRQCVRAWKLDEYSNIFEYSYNIYSDICSFIYIRIFIRVKMFTNITLCTRGSDLSFVTVWTWETIFSQKWLKNSYFGGTESG